MSPLDPALFPVHAAVAFIVGSMFGSFFNVVIWRAPRRFSIVLPGSHCTRCGTPLRWHDNIPLLSQVLLDRRCRICGSEISLRYGAVELLTALLFLAVFWRFGLTGATPLYLVFVSLCLIATFTDIDHWIIPDGVSLGGLAAGLAAAATGPLLGAGHLPARQTPFDGTLWWHGLAGAALGAAIGWSVLKGVAVLGRLLFRKEAMGGGDITLMAMFGAYLGWQGVLATLILACLLGALFGGTLLLFDKLRERRRGGPLGDPPQELPADLDPAHPEGFRRAVAHLDLHRKERSVSTHIPFGPYLCVAAVAVLFLFEPIVALFEMLYIRPILG